MMGLSRRAGAFGLALLMLAAGNLAAPAPSVEARDATVVLTVDQDYTVKGDEGWLSVRVIHDAVLRVPAGASLTAEYIQMDSGSLVVDGGSVFLNGPETYLADSIEGTVDWFNLTDGARLIIQGINGNPSRPMSAGGGAVINLDVTAGATLSDCTIELSGGDGYSNPEPWVQGGELNDATAHGGAAGLRLGMLETPFVYLNNANITLCGGKGGDAADGKDATGNDGGAGGGYSNGGDVGGYVGSGGRASLSLSGASVTVNGSAITLQGGDGGHAGDGGGSEAGNNTVVGGGGGGGYSGGDGGGYQPMTYGTPPAAARPGGNVSGHVGAGGGVELRLYGENTSVLGSSVLAVGGNGGDGGKGGSGNAYCGGGGGGYGGGGGCSCVYGLTAPVPPNDGGMGGLVDGEVGAGGSVSVGLNGTGRLEVEGLELTAMGGVGGDGGAGGGGGKRGGGGGGGFGGGGGGTYQSSVGGDGTVSGRAGAGGSVGVELQGGPMELASSNLLLLGGAAGLGGAGGAGGGNAGGGGGGFGGGGGGGYDGEQGLFRAGAGYVSGEAGQGGNASFLAYSESGPGKLAARNNTLFLCGGAGWEGGVGGAAGPSGGGGGGYSGGGGMSPNEEVPYVEVGGNVGDGGDAVLEVRHPAPSLSRINSLTVRGGEAGDGKASMGEGTSGGMGLGRITAGGIGTKTIPMSTPRLLSPAEGELINVIPPTFEWEPVLYSTTDGDVESYAIQIDSNPDFASPEADTGVENDTTFTTTSELSMGGVYYWRVQAVYQTGRTAGYGPARRLLLNTPPVLAFYAPVLRFDEDTTAYHLLNLSKMFKDDLFSDRLNYTIIYESDPTHILGEVDDHFLTFSTPMKDWYGLERFAVKATDPFGLWCNSNNFTVRVTPVNDAPSVSPIPEVSVTTGEDCLYDLAPYISDVDTPPEALTLSTDSEYAWAEGLALHLNFTGPGPKATVRIRVGDGNSTANSSFDVNIIFVDRPPVISEIPAIATGEDTPVFLNLTPYVSDDTTLPEWIRWTVDSVAAGSPPLFEASISDVCFLLVVPAGNASGNGSLVLKAIDLEGRSGSRTVSVTIKAVNNPPVITPVPEVEVLAGFSATVELGSRIHDPDTPREQLRLVCLSPLGSVDGFTLLITIRADFEMNRTTIPVRVTDGDLSAETNITVWVRFPPAISPNLPQVRTRMGEKMTLDLSTYALDRNVPPTVLTWEVVGPAGKHFTAVIERDGSTLRITPLRPGWGNLTLVVRNRYNGTDYRTISVTVLEKPAGRYDWTRWPVTAGAFIAVAVISYLAFRARRPMGNAPAGQGAREPAKGTGPGRRRIDARARRR